MARSSTLPARKVLLPRGASDAVFLPYHVDRSKMFAMERVKGVAQLDNDRIARDKARAFRRLASEDRAMRRGSGPPARR